MLPFTREQFLEVFAAYNQAVWPAWVAAYLIGVAIAFALWQPSPARSRWVAAGLALMWGWTGVAYHGVFFAAINPAAFAFGALFALQGLLFAHAGILRSDLAWSHAHGWRAALGWVLIAYAATIYPLVGVLAGHGYPALPMFGITPCPVTLFTLGALLLARPVPRRLLVIPFLWTLVGGSAAFLLGIAQDWPLLVSGLVVVPMLWHHPRVASGRTAQA